MLSSGPYIPILFHLKKNLCIKREEKGRVLECTTIAVKGIFISIVLLCEQVLPSIKSNLVNSCWNVRVSLELVRQARVLLGVYRLQQREKRTRLDLTLFRTLKPIVSTETYSSVQSKELRKIPATNFLLDSFFIEKNLAQG